MSLNRSRSSSQSRWRNVLSALGGGSSRAGPVVETGNVKYTDPIHLSLHGNTLVFDDGDWKSISASAEGAGAARPAATVSKASQERMEALEAENRMLKFRVELLVDMLTGAHLDYQVAVDKLGQLEQRSQSKRRAQ